jgi:aminopeptidase-like protein
MKNTSLTWEDLIEFTERNYKKNRTIVSRDIPVIFDDLERTVGLPVERVSYKSGEEHGTWVVPPRWDIREAWLKDKTGELIASYDDHPLFVAPYSSPVRTTVSREELLAHTVSHAGQPDAYQYNWRFALDARLRLQDWGLSLPQNLIDRLPEGPFDLCIDAEVEPGEMLVGEMVLPGDREEELLIVADYCHPGQVNDSFSGLILFMKLMHELARMPNRRYTYRFLFLPETIGSAVHIAADPSRFDRVLGGVFSEMIAWGETWYLKASRSGASYMDLLAADVYRTFDDIKHADFRSYYKNDELMFDSVQVGIPMLALQKYPFAEYHSSNDEPSRMLPGDLQHALDVMLHLVDVLERDRVVAYAHPVPVWMTRYGLFSDSVPAQADYERRFQLGYCLLDGQASVLQVANMLDERFESSDSSIREMEHHELVRVVDVVPARMVT